MHSSNVNSIEIVYNEETIGDPCMNYMKLAVLLVLLGCIAAQAADQRINKAIRNIEDRIPDMRNIPIDSIDIKQPPIEMQMPEQALEDVQQRLKELDVAALKTLDPLQNLPKELPIMDKAGQTVLIEKEVEDGWRAVANQWLLMLDNQDIDQLNKVNAVIIKKTELQSLDMALVQFRVPNEFDSLSVLKKHLPAEWIKQLGRNHIYEANSDPAGEQLVVQEEGLKIQKAVCGKSVKVGLIDTGVEESHQAFSKASIQAKNFMSEDISVPTAHGTAVAGLLIGQHDELVPLLPNATLYAASVFYPRNEYSQGAALINLVQALDWLVLNNVSVINMSLTGPENPILQQAIERTGDKGTMIVAAVGNEGPASQPLYPAAYPEVIGATAVDKKQQIYRWANQGDYVDFAALGVSVLTARASNQLGRESGTSIAAPVISSFVACYANGLSEKENVVTELNKQVIDLGRTGKDKVFGNGLLHP